jgi:hypothetical protein
MTTDTTVFPILDSPRIYANESLNRFIMNSFGYAEPYLDESDSWVAMPVRLTHDAGGGWRIELGPYSFGACDILPVKEAIAAWEAAVDNRHAERDGCRADELDRITSVRHLLYSTAGPLARLAAAYPDNPDVEAIFNTLAIAKGELARFIEPDEDSWPGATPSARLHLVDPDGEDDAGA